MLSQRAHTATEDPPFDVRGVIPCAEIKNVYWLQLAWFMVPHLYVLIKSHPVVAPTSFICK